MAESPDPDDHPIMAIRVPKSNGSRASLANTPVAQYDHDPTAMTAARGMSEDRTGPLQGSELAIEGEHSLSRAERRNHKAGVLTAWLASTHSEVHAVDGGFLVEDTTVAGEDGAQTIQKHYTHFGDSRDDDSPPSLKGLQSPSGEDPLTPPGGEPFHQVLLRNGDTEDESSSQHGDVAGPR